MITKTFFSQFFFIFLYITFVYILHSTIHIMIYQSVPFLCTLSFMIQVPLSYIYIMCLSIYTRRTYNKHTHTQTHTQIT